MAGPFITQGNRWTSGGPISPQKLLAGIMCQMDVAFAKSDRVAYELARDQLTVFSEAHLKEDKSNLWEEYGMSRQMGIMADLLHSRMGKIVSSEQLLNAMYFDRPDGGPSSGPDIIKVRLCGIRKKLEQSPYEIETLWGQGYRMVERKPSKATDHSRHGHRYEAAA